MRKPWWALCGHLGLDLWEILRCIPKFSGINGAHTGSWSLVFFFIFWCGVLFLQLYFPIFPTFASSLEFDFVDLHVEPSFIG